MEENKNLNTQTNNSDNITFDYNQLYGVDSAQNNAPQQQTNIPNMPTIEQTPIILEEQKPKEEPVVSDIIPTFDTNALQEDLPEELKPKVEEPLVHTIASDAQKEKQENRRNLLFIIMLFAVLIIAVFVVFPLMLNI